MNDRPKLTCAPNPCSHCQSLLVYDSIYAVIALSGLIIFGLDVTLTKRVVRQSQQSHRSNQQHQILSMHDTHEMNASDQLEQSQDDVELQLQMALEEPNTIQSTADDQASAAVPSSSSSSSSNNVDPHIRPLPIPPSFIGSILSKRPRVSLALLATLHLTLCCISLWACIQFIDIQCRDYLAASILNFMVTFNAAIGAIVGIIRYRQQIFSAQNPFEAMGLI